MIAQYDQFETNQNILSTRLQRIAKQSLLLNYIEHYWVVIDSESRSLAQKCLLEVENFGSAKTQTRGCRVWKPERYICLPWSSPLHTQDIHQATASKPLTCPITSYRVVKCKSFNIFTEPLKKELMKTKQSFLIQTFETWNPDLIQIPSIINKVKLPRRSWKLNT